MCESYSELGCASGRVPDVGWLGGWNTYSNPFPCTCIAHLFILVCSCQPSLPPPSQILQLGRDIAAGLAYLHPSVIHRDLKPQVGATVQALCVGGRIGGRLEVWALHMRHGPDLHLCPHSPARHKQNVLLDRTGRAKLADFGISRFKDPHRSFLNVTQQGGTPQYMAPELFNGSR